MTFDIWYALAGLRGIQKLVVDARTRAEAAEIALEFASAGRERLTLVCRPFIVSVSIRPTVAVAPADLRRAA